MGNELYIPKGKRHGKQVTEFQMTKTPLGKNSKEEYNMPTHLTAATGTGKGG
jgi:hypothetical protein